MKTADITYSVIIAILTFSLMCFVLFRDNEKTTNPIQPITIDKNGIFKLDGKYYKLEPVISYKIVPVDSLEEK